MKKNYLPVLLLLSALFMTCESIEKFTIVRTVEVKNITGTSADITGMVVFLSNKPHPEYGFCYSTTQNPAYEGDKKQLSGVKKGEFNANLSGLNPNTTYHVRAYVLDDNEPVYSQQQSFKTTEAVLEISAAGKEITADSGTFSFTINANIPWTISENEEWIEISQSSGNDSTSITVTYGENTTNSERKSEITISATGINSKTIQVTQLANEVKKTLEISANTLNISTNQGTVNFTITSNTDWTIEGDASWLNPDKTAGAGNDTIVLHFENNPSVNSRSTDIIILSTGLQNKTITITQAGKEPTLSISTDSEFLASQAGSFSFEVVSNTDWTIVNSEDWLHPDKTSGQENDSITIHYDENTDTKERSTTITISSSGLTDKTIQITQAGKGLNLLSSTSSENVPATSGSFTFDITSNTSWTISNNAGGWLHINPTSDTGDKTITVSYDENIFTQPKEASITIQANNLQKIITVTQEGSSAISEIVTDKEGNIYKTVQIGNQVWMAENLKSTKYDDGSSIHGYYRLNSYVEDPENYGLLYTWDAAMNKSTNEGAQGACPAGWHIPTNTEWADLEVFLSDDNLVIDNLLFQYGTRGTENYGIGNMLKEEGYNHWNEYSSPNNGNNLSGFYGIGAGKRHYSGRFEDINYRGYYWTSTEYNSEMARYRYLQSDVNGIYNDSDSKIASMSIRCIKDALSTNYLDISKTEKNIPSSSGTFTFDITSNTSWTVSEQSSWLEIGQFSGNGDNSITVTYNQNTSASERVAEITVTADGLSDKIITVTQAGIEYYLNLSDISLNLSASGGSITFDISSNTHWTISEYANWFTLYPAVGDGDATITIEYDENTATEERSEKISINGTGVGLQSVTFTQSGADPLLLVSTNEITVTSAQGSITFDITSNLDWNVAEPETWLSAAPASGNGNGTITITYEENTQTIPRSLYIKVTALGVPEQTIVFTQEKPGETTGTVEDVDGNTYETVKIGEQWWMAENLATTQYNDNTEIPLVEDAGEWANLSTPAYCWYDNDDGVMKEEYGGLYNWHVVETGKVCPTGWHVPTDKEWKEMEMHLGMSRSDADDFGYRGEGIATKLKSTYGWDDGNGTNESGFNALPGGYRNNTDGSFYFDEWNGNWWTNTPSGDEYAWNREMFYNKDGVRRFDYDRKTGFSIRCVKD